MINGKLICPRCKNEKQVLDILQNSSVSWPHKNWILFTCYDCKESSHVEIKDKELSIGGLDGAPGPILIKTACLFVSELSVSKTVDYISCRYGDSHYTFIAMK